jgi:chemotaxis protein histidine kinase CheA
LYRQIHTFKSLLAQIRCPALPSTLHAVEERLQGYQESAPQQITVQELLPVEGIDSQLQAALQILERQLPAHLFERDPHLPLPRRLHQDVVDFLESHHSALAQQLREVQFQRFSSLLKPHFEMAQMLAQSQGKLLSAIRFEGEDPKVDAEYYQPFFQVLVHLFRNAIDHGIEAPSERNACGKPAVASIRCQLQRQGESLKLTISDDGRGIALEQVRQKALALQLLNQQEAEQWSSEQIAQCIFADALSTKTEVNLVSGRGIGLAAVKQQLANFDASIRVTAQPGKGCTFAILLPIRAEFLALNPLQA